MSNKYLHVIPYIECDIYFGIPLLASLGLIYSICVFDYFFEAFYCSNNWRRNEFMIDAIKKTHYILAFTTVYLLYIGFKDTNKGYIRLYLNLKMFEFVGVLNGTVVLLMRCLLSWPYFFLTVLILGYGRYIIKNVQRGFDELSNEERNSLPSEFIEILDSLEQENVKLPLYSDFLKKYTDIPINSN